MKNSKQKGSVFVVTLVSIVIGIAVIGGLYFTKFSNLEQVESNIQDQVPSQDQSVQTSVDGSQVAPETLKSPTLTKITPTSGPAGALVTVSGSGFSGSWVSVSGSGSDESRWEITPTSITPNSVTFVIPSDATAGTYVVVVGNQEEDWRTSSGHVLFTIDGVIMTRDKTPDQVKSDDTMIVNGLKSLRMMAEQYYSNNDLTYIGFCADNYGGVDLIWNDIYGRNVGGKSGVKCNVSKNEYAISSTLNNDKYACVDFIGVSVDNLTKHPLGTMCK